MENPAFSHHYHPIIQDEDDILKIETPRISHDEEKSEEDFQAYQDIFGGILKVEKRGAPGFGFSPWDDLVKFTGAQQALLDLALRPAFIHALVDRLTEAYLDTLDQFERLNLLALNNTNVRIGSGAYGYADELPADGYEAGRVRAVDIWGSATAQIFAEVSPEMHEDFALRYESRWMARFGLAYYGCCEPLHDKMGILRRIPNLRKVSVSPWNDLERMAEETAGDYVFSYKPSPAVLATDVWNPELAAKELENMLEITHRHRCPVELIMKDITTVRYQPQRLWEWTRMAAEAAERIGEGS
jgi:hypothetical protein